MTSTLISCMLAVTDTPAASEWYGKALGARVVWSLGSVAGLEIGGAMFLLHEPVKGRFANPKEIGTTTVRVEVFVDDPQAMIDRAKAAGADAHDVRDHQTPFGIHRQGGLVDPFGHVWHIGDKTPLQWSSPV